MNKNTKNILTVLFVFLVVSIFFYLQKNKTSEEVKKLESVEVKEYEGKDLSSIGDFRENSIKGPQYINKENYNLKVTGLSGEDISLSYDEIIGDKQKYEKVVTLNCVEGWSVTILWEGVLVKDILKRELVPESAKAVIFHAHDGYSTSFPIEYIYDNDIIMAYKMNGVELPPERGFPFQLVAENKYGYKWIKWITKIEFTEDINYEGYWESRGYSNSGDLDKKFIK